MVGVDSLAALEAKLAEFDGCALATHGSPPLFAAGTPGACADAGRRHAVGGARCSAATPGCCSTGCSPRSSWAVTAPISPTSSTGPRRAAARLPPAEIAACAPFLRRQIELARPRVILALGGAAAAALTGATAGINRLRGKWQTLAGSDVPVLPSFHPAQLLAQPGLKALAWTDLQALQARLDA